MVQLKKHKDVKIKLKTNLSDENKWNPSDIWMVKDGCQQ